MANKTEYKVLADSHIEKLIDKLNSKELAEWRVVGTIQEHGYTKVIIEKEYT